ncbi:MAG: carboxypeptidase M32 [Pseudomonadota bacterium]
MTHPAYDALLAHHARIAALDRVSGLLSWDQEVMMPPKGAEARAEEAGALAAVLHGLRTDPRIGEWLAAVPEETLDATGRANLRLARRDFARATRVPPDLAEEIARTTARGQGVWAAARRAGRFADFAPTLAHILRLKRVEADCLADGDAPYDALLDAFEPGAEAPDIAAIFDRLRPGLVALRDRIAGSDVTPPTLAGPFPAAAQMAASQDLAACFHYDFEAGRLDLSVHPFTSGDRADTRITTRVGAADPLECLFATVHEVGHALYGQGLPTALAGQPAGADAGMGIHESQSRFFENQAGRAAAFTPVLWQIMERHFGTMGLAGPEALHAAVNAVHPGFIRTEADEVHYNLHIMLRFDLERALFAGDLEVADLPEAWDKRFEADFGVAVPDAARGVLQDVHWSVGLFGYFPTYALGNIYAACLDRALRRDVDLDACLGAGDLAPVVGWMREKVHARARHLMPTELIAEATGAPPSEAPLLAYLEAKYGALYRL